MMRSIFAFYAIAAVAFFAFGGTLETLEDLAKWTAILLALLSAIALVIGAVASEPSMGSPAIVTAANSTRSSSRPLGRASIGAAPEAEISGRRGIESR